ncbi:MAG: hypothetical protein ACI4EH_08335 [Oliverpabstia sp.]
MRKKSLTALLISAMLLGACASGNSTDSADKEPQTTPEVTEAAKEDSGEAKTISPIPSGLDLTNLADVTLHVSFDAKSAYLNDDGALVLDMVVYDHDVYDAVDITQLAEGDTIVVNGENILVESKKAEGELICINGGEGEGGFNLTSSGGGTFCIVGLDDRHSYYEAANVTLAVDQECVLIDDADLDNPGITLYAGDLLSLEDDAYSYTPYNTTVTVASGKIIEIHRVYTP